jgi:four helix bundle protein
MSNSYRDLVVWQKAKQLSLAVYRLTKAFPREEIYGLTSQLRRAAVSVVSNIAEGQGRNTIGEFLQFLGHARGSLSELQTQLEIASELGYIKPTDFEKIEDEAEHVRAMILRLIESLQAKSRSAKA